MRLLLAALLTVAMIGAATAQVWIMSPSGGGRAVGAQGGGPPVTNYLLLVDGTSYLLQTDAASKICLAGGC